MANHRMQDYTDVPAWIQEEDADDRFADALLQRTAEVINKRSGGNLPLLGLALDIQPRLGLIELSLLFDSQVTNRSKVTDWDQYHVTANSDLTSVWQPVRDAFAEELKRWQTLSQAHPKAGALFIYTLLVTFVFNLNTGRIAAALAGSRAAKDLQIYALNHEDPNLPNIFEVEHGRVTLNQLSPETPATEPGTAEPPAPSEDPRQIKFF